MSDSQSDVIGKGDCSDSSYLLFLSSIASNYELRFESDPFAQKFIEEQIHSLM
jgi:hypothetical protein